MFCDIVRGAEEAHVAYRGRGVLVILDKYPVSKGHLLVIPEEHYEGVQDAPPRVLAKVWLAASAIARYYRERLKCPGVNVVTNSGRYSGQVIFHFHVHIIPRWSIPAGFWAGRHVLSEEEAREVLDMLSQDSKALIEEYISHAE